MDNNLFEIRPYCQELESNGHSPVEAISEPEGIVYACAYCNEQIFYRCVVCNQPFSGWLTYQESMENHKIHAE